jgi:hypothetical protein
MNKNKVPVKKLTQEEKLDRVIQWLTEGHLESEGGYPYDYETHAGRVFIASLEDDLETELLSYDLKALEKWYDRAAAYVAEQAVRKKAAPEAWPEFTGAGFGLWAEAFGETEEP